VECERPFALGFGLQLPTEGRARRDARQLQPIQERLDVVVAAADDQRNSAPARDAGQRQIGGVDEVGRRERLLRPEKADQVVRHAGQIGRWRLGGADFQPAVDLARVGRDDLAVQRLGQTESEVRLPHSGWSDYQQDRRTPQERGLLGGRRSGIAYTRH
jgi:hypothetical protein